MSRDESQHPDSLGFLNYTGALQAGDDLKVENGTTVEAAEACVSSCWFDTHALCCDTFDVAKLETAFVHGSWCATNISCEGITYNANSSQPQKRVYFKRGITLNADAAWGSRIKATHAPPGPQTQQIWVKRVSPATDDGGPTMAVLFVNAGPTNSTANFGVTLAELGITSARGASVRNIWKHQDESPISAGGRLDVAIAGHSSLFYKIAPK